MRSSKVAIRYAQSLLDLALEKGLLESVEGNMAYLTEVNNDNRDFQLLLSSPIIQSSKKVAILKEIFGAFDALSIGFIELIAKNGREAYLPEIAGAFTTLLKQHRGIVPITIVSATKLDATVKQHILQKVQATTTGTIEVTEELDAELIGGFVVKMGDLRIDASVASKISDLKQRLTR